MPQIINTNIASLNAQRNLNTSQQDSNVALQRLSSGLRINSAKDDAAGLAISERFTSQIKGLNQAEVARAKAKGTRGYESGGIVFQQLPLGLRQLQSGRAISQPRGYLSRAAGLTLPSAQAFQNITPESREIFMDLASQAGIPPRSFEQELSLAIPRGQRQPTARILPLSRRGIR